MGGTKDPVWRVVVADQRSKRDGRVIETIGHYNAQTNPSTIMIDEERARVWLARGAPPSHTVRKLLRIQGIAQLTGSSRPMTTDTTQELLEYLAEGLVDDPEQVTVERFEEADGTVVLELRRGAGRLREGDRARRAHRAGAAHRDPCRGGGAQRRVPRRHRRLWCRWRVGCRRAARTGSTGASTWPVRGRAARAWVVR